ncbi:hypothetical protein VTN00DRAFT_5413 [Thermoascus crustaceus]|uniref:uncharacterized protein n=1 Tax=Thermoascus crustaceus TaxID=5088 RepID=UPI0037427BBA
MLHVAGKDMAVFTAPSQVTQIFKDNNSYSFDPFMDMVYDDVGNVSREAKLILWRTPAEGFVSLHPNPKQQVLVHTGNGLLHKQLLQPDAMQDLLVKVLVYINNTMQWDSFYETTVLASNADEKVVSLHCWCRDVLIEAQNRTWFGHCLEELELDMRLVFDKWDYNSWRITYQVPSFMAKPATRPRDRLIQDECMHAGLGNRDIAGILMIILWGINSNVQMTAFWMVARLMKKPAVVAEIRNEIAAAMEAIDSSLNMDEATLADLTKQKIINNCSVLNSTFNEILRFCSTGSSIREAMRDTNIDSYHISKGTKIILPQRNQLVVPRCLELDLTVGNEHKADSVGRGALLVLAD